MESLKKIVGNVVFVIQILILFLLLFENRIELPPFLQAVGRIHPLMLHLPIGLLIVMSLLAFMQTHFEAETLKKIISYLLYLTSLTASLAAFMGLILSMEGVYNGQDIVWHKWLGVLLSFLCAALLIIQHHTKLMRFLVHTATALLIVTSHFGGALTHGDNFVMAPLEVEEMKIRIFTDSSTVYNSTVDAIFESKCYSCHNNQKSKGKLILTSLQSTLEGGKNGLLWKPKDPEHSLIIERLALPLDNKEHMPPKDKAQLTDDEVRFISLWIAAGADVKKRLNELPPNDTIKKLAAVIIPRYHLPEPVKSIYQFAFVSKEKIQKLSIPNRTVFQIASNEPALQADFYLKQSYQKEFLSELKEVKDQLISINLSNMPVEDEDLKDIAEFKNLERLILNNTNIKGEGLADLKNLEHLTLLSLSGTPTQRGALDQLGAFKNLKEVFLWNTALNKSDLEELKLKYDNINWQIGYVPDLKESLKLNLPSVKNESQILLANDQMLLKHNLPGAIVRYTTNGNDPDSVVSNVYKDPINASAYNIVKAKAFKDGWQSSDIAEFVFFKNGFKPAKAELLTQPDEKYQGEGAITLIDEKKGLPDFYKDPAWIGFRNNPLAIYLFFDGTTPTIRNITLSYARNIGAMCMPPEEMELWGGVDREHLKFIKKFKPKQPSGYVSTRIEGASFDITPSTFKCYKLIARPLTKLPEYRKAKNEKGWLMVDEIFLN